MANVKALNYFEKDFHTNKYKPRTIARNIPTFYTKVYSFFDLNSLRINAFRGGEIKYGRI